VELAADSGPGQGFLILPDGLRRALTNDLMFPYPDRTLRLLTERVKTPS
jgi:hypothetical protein